MKNARKKHCIDSCSWGMAKIMHSVLLDATETAFAPFVYIRIFVDKVMTIDNTQWFWVHFYVVQASKRIPILLWIKTIGVLAISYDIFVLLVEGYSDFGGLGLEELGTKLVNMGYDGSNVFQGHQIGVKLVQRKIAHFLIGVHYFAHKIWKWSLCRSWI